MSNPHTLNPEESEQLRHAALDALCLRHPAAVSSRAVARAVDREVMFQVDDTVIESALEFLRDKGLVKFESDDLGSTKWWQITAQGLQQIERAGK